ncbi:MAG: hypothetical protein ACFFCQ_15420, partial [Promethearchaeota archaeon]
MRLNRFFYSFTEISLFFIIFPFSINESIALEQIPLEEVISEISLDNLRHTISNLTSFPNIDQSSRRFGTVGS